MLHVEIGRLIEQIPADNPGSIQDYQKIKYTVNVLVNMLRGLRSLKVKLTLSTQR
jgi:hypothetical protein